MESKGLAGTVFTAVTPKGKMRLRVNVPGHHMVSNALAAVAIGLELGLDERQEWLHLSRDQVIAVSWRQTDLR